MTASIFVIGLNETDVVTASYGSKIKFAVWNNTESRHEITKIVDNGMWTVTATNAWKSQTQNVFVDAAADFEIEMIWAPNYVMLYDHGDECEDVTGGLSFVLANAGGSGSGGSITKNTNNISFATTSAYANARVYNIVTANKIDFSLYTISTVYANISAGFGYISFLSDSTIRFDITVGSGEVGSKLIKQDISTILENMKARLCLFGNNASSPYTFNGSIYSMTLFKPDDWGALCQVAGITTPTTLTDLISNVSDISAILASENAVGYMLAKCTGDFMASFVTNADCLIALESSPYRDLVCADCHWSKFLAMVGVTA